MATIKSVLALEDKMTPTLSKAEKQAISNAKAYNDLDKQMKFLEKTMQDLERQGKSQSDMYYKLSDAWDRTRDSMKQYANGTLQAKEGTDNVKHSLTELNQGLELVRKGYSLLQSAMGKINELVDANNNQFNAQYTAATKMHNMMGASKDEIESMYDYASALQSVGVIGDEAIISGMGILSTSATNTESLKQLANAAANAAVGVNGLNTTQTTYETVAGYVQKALEGSAQMLYRNQILTKKQADYVDSLNDTTEKEAALVQMLSDNFGNANEMLAQTAQGGMMQAQNKMSDMKEELGEKLMPIISGFTTFITDVLGPALEFLGDNIDVLAPAFLVLAGAIIAATVAQWALNIAEASNPIGFIIMAIAIWIIMIILLWEKCEWFREAIVGQWAALAKGIGRMYNHTVNVYNGIQDMLQFLTDSAYAAFSALINMFADTAISMIKSGNSIIGIFKKIVEAYNAIAGAVGGKTINVSAAFSEEGINALRDSALSSFKGMLPQAKERKALMDIGALDSLVDSNAAKVTDFTLSGYLNDKLSGVSDIIPSVDDMQKTLDDITVPTKGGGGGGGGAGKAVQTTTNDSLLSDEEMQLLLDVATRDYKLSYQQITPNITLTFGDIRETADVDEILDQVADRLEEIYDSNLEVNAG